MTYQFWTNKQVKKLAELAETMTASEIAKQINRSRGSVLGKAARMNIEIVREHCNKRWTPQELSLLETQTASQVAKITGRTYNAVWAKLSRKLAA